MSREESICLEIVEAIAEHDGTTPEKLHPPLHDAIETDALDALFTPDDADRRPSAVEFTYDEYTVRVDADAEITITDLEATADRPATSQAEGPSHRNDTPYC
ncbi:HalOD1 output domain-containing protein [Natrarchaeobius chitinivorans]|uniref:Halobacterial output domain-containing protein n=1 Tax=Natrarchaeobius chitinivorans TaxID=1679083 RepID=A0A3N6MC50_NATCH|nr:HalOD1 output domain-containing protein [Natrarchaeobius chitinivorans]RQG94090.1 hypothetical protein EA473_13575 [Natrarchaeobius chitinivorans]